MDLPQVVEQNRVEKLGKGEVPLQPYQPVVEDFVSEQNANAVAATETQFRQVVLATNVKHNQHQPLNVGLQSFCLRHVKRVQGVGDVVSC